MIPTSTKNRPKGSPTAAKPRRKPTYVVQPGDKFDHLTVIGQPYSNGSMRYVLVECVCGTRKPFTVTRLFHKDQIHSCGCHPHKATLLTHAGRTQNVTAWAAELGISPEALHSRIKHGWSVEDALTTGKRARRSQDAQPA